MKNSLEFRLAALCLGFILLFSSCISSQSLRPIKGSGPTVDKSFNISDFHAIEVSGGFDVLLSQGNSESVTLSAQENLYEYIHVEVVQGVLKIYTRNNLWATQPLKAKIMFRNLDKLNVSGGGDVTAGNDLKVEDLAVGITGGGDVTAGIDARELTCRISGGGDARIKGSATKYDFDMTGGGDLETVINAGSIYCRLSGGGDLALRSENEATEIVLELTGGGDAEAVLNTRILKCALSGGGNASLSGKTGNFDLTLNGGGDLHASELETNTASFQVSGGSDVHFNVSDELKGNISGGGDVYYSGSPETVSIDARGGSEVHKE